MENDDLSIVVVGASGDLSRKKIFPALFALYCQGFLPSGFNIIGFARTRFSDEEFRAHITGSLVCRYTPGEDECALKMDEFLSRCCYVQGDYGSKDSFLDLYQRLNDIEGGSAVPRMFYLAVPPVVYTDIAKSLGDTGLVSCTADEPWSRVVVEKPFGMDRESSDELICKLDQVFTEDQVYRIDHYLGKEVIQNLLVLRFANLVFAPLWNREYIYGIEIEWKEDMGIEGRSGYFDKYGIIRDVMQNHLVQIFALAAMEPPEKLDYMHIARQKVEVLSRVLAPEADNIFTGQYGGYLEEDGVPGDSATPTFAATTLHINNDRWQGVPFTLTAGKGLDSSLTEIRIKFKAVANNVFCNNVQCPEPNMLVIRVQPDEAINLRITNKVPGMGMRIDTKMLDLRYDAVFDDVIPDAYESLLLDVIRGDRSLFIGRDELGASWDIFTGALHEMEMKNMKPVQYEFGATREEVLRLGSGNWKLGAGP